MDAGSGDATQGSSVPGAPQVRAPDVRTEFLKMFLSVDGRIGRQRFIAYSVLAYVALEVAIMPTFALLALALGERGMQAGGMGAAVVISLAAQVVCQFILLRRRLRDANRSPWEMLLIFVPLLNLYIMFSPGTAGPNRFGPAPPPTPRWLSVTVLLVLLGVFAFALSEQR